WTKKSLAQRRLESLFKEGKIDPDDKPGTVYDSDPEFQKYTKDVFRAHFNKIKSKHGQFLNNEATETKKRDADLFEFSEDEDSDNNSVINLLVNTPMPAKPVPPHPPIKPTPKKLKREGKKVAEPILTAVYNDPETLNERVIIVAILPSGCTDVTFTVGDDGNVAFIHYTWPSVMYNTEEMFEKWLVTRKIECYHPKIVAISQELEKVRDSVEAAPEGVIRVQLPISVQKDTRTFVKNGFEKRDGSKVFMVELQAHQKSYAITTEDKCIEFERW
ncbi:hypothetical protein HK098_000580, partial [Nowakowskiella sp. JEL0407]